MSDIFTRVLLTENLKLKPEFIDKHFPQRLERYLKEKIESKCTKHGYVKKDSIKVYKMSPGKVEVESLNGDLLYTIYFHADVCNPLTGSCILSQITKSNKIALLAIAENLEIIIMKEGVDVRSEVDLSKLSINDKVNVEILSTRFTLGQTKIEAIGKVVKDSRSTKATAKEDEPEAEVEQDLDDDVEGDLEAEEEDEEEDEDEEQEGGTQNDSDEEVRGDSRKEFFQAGDEFYGSDEEDEIEGGYDEAQADFDDDKIEDEGEISE